MTKQGREPGRRLDRPRGLGEGFVDAIHPDDEMYLFLRAAPFVRDGTLRFHYFRSGYEILLALEHLLATAGRNLAGFDSVLEFACGYGRFTRFLTARVEPQRIWAYDLQRDGVEYVARTFGVHGRESKADPATLRFERRFDLIVVISLFSHLPKGRFREWLEALYAALSPGGLLVFSTHGESVAPGLPKDPSGFTFIGDSESDRLDPGEYGTAYVTAEAVRRLAAEAGIRHVYRVERELSGFQDLYAVSKRRLPGLELWSPASVVQGRIDVTRLEPDSGYSLAGWAADRSRSHRVIEVRVEIDGRPLGNATIGRPRPDVAQVLGRDDWGGAGWQAEGTLPPLERGDHWLDVYGVSSSGLEMPFDQLAVNSAHLPLKIGLPD